MHLVFLNQYYPPDAAPTGVMLEAVVEELVRQGHAVTVICASGGYASRSGGVPPPSQHEDKNSGRDVPATLQPPCVEDAARRSIHDLRRDAAATICDRESSLTVIRIGATRFGRGTFVGKLVDYVSFYLGVTWKLLWLRPRADRVVALTTPPFLSVVARFVSKIRGGDHAHWVMDLYPDVMVAHGMLAEGGVGHRVLRGLARWGFGGKRCAAVLTLGPDMARRTADMGEEEFNAKAGRSRRVAKVEWVALWGEANGDDSRSVGVSPTSRSGGVSPPECVGVEEELERDTSGTIWSQTLQPLSEEEAAGCSLHGLRRDAAATSASLALRAWRGWGDEDLVVMYSGNMGLGHRFGEVLEVIGGISSGEGSASDVGGKSETGRNAPAPDGSGTLQPPAGGAPQENGAEGRGFHGLRRDAAAMDHGSRSVRLRFAFFGGGKRLGEIEAFVSAHPDAPVELHGYVPREELAGHLASADVHLVSLEPAWTGTMVPSKLQGIFAVGRPVIFLGSAESSIGRWVEESGGGWVVDAGDVPGLKSALREAGDEIERRKRGRAAADFARRNFDKATNVRRVAEIFGRESD